MSVLVKKIPGLYLQTSRLFQFSTKLFNKRVLPYQRKAVLPCLLRSYSCTHQSNSMLLKLCVLKRRNLYQCLLHTSSRRPVNPVILYLFKFKGLKVLKGMSILVGRVGRKVHGRLPLRIQQQFSRHKITLYCIILSTVTICYYSYVHRDTCPITGRRRWISFTREQILTLAKMDQEHVFQMYKNKFIGKEEPLFKTCLSLVNALVNSNKDIDIVKEINWSLNVIDDVDMQNAFVLPNGEIFLFTGMINVMNNLEELAIVLGHEMAHAILGHVQEQQTFTVFGELLLVPLLAFIWFFFEDFVAFIAYSLQQYVFNFVFAVGFNLPYSRQLESEADVVGLDLASKACFDPRWAVFLWDKLALKEAVDSTNTNNAEDTTVIEFMSSHPSHQKRATVLESRIAEMIEIRKKCNCPELPLDVDPLQSAHRLRKFATILRERQQVLIEINECKSKQKDNKGNNSDDEVICKQLEKRLELLTSTYQTMLEEEGVAASSYKYSSTVSNARHVLSSERLDRPILKKFDTWSNLVGRFINLNTLNPVKKSTDSLITCKLDSSAYGKKCVKRDHYDNF